MYVITCINIIYVILYLVFLNSSDQTIFLGKINSIYKMNVFHATFDSDEFINNEMKMLLMAKFSLRIRACIVWMIFHTSEMNFSTPSSNDICHQFQPPLPVFLLQSNRKEHDISKVKVDKILYSPNGTQKFSDEDLNTCLLMYNNS